MNSPSDNTARGEDKIFCLSIQRSGSTSVGDFLENLGLVRPGWAGSRDNKWAELFFEAKYEELFGSTAFKKAQVLDDGPWWYPKFYEMLHDRFPQAKFILVERDADSWFQSMCLHSGGRNPGHTGRHCKIYQRQEDLQWLVDNYGVNPELRNQIDITCSASHYKKIYRAHYADCRAYFTETKADFFSASLTDSDLFERLAKFVGHPNEKTPVHTNRSDQRQKHRLMEYLRHLRGDGKRPTP